MQLLNQGSISANDRRMNFLYLEVLFFVIIAFRKATFKKQVLYILIDNDYCDSMSLALFIIVINNGEYNNNN